MNPTAIMACATCMGSPGHQTSIAAGNAIMVMLWILLGMAMILGCFVFTLVRRARRYASENGIPSAPDPLEQYYKDSSGK